MTILSLKSRPGASFNKRTIMSVPYRLKLIVKFVTIIRLKKEGPRITLKQTKIKLKLHT